MNNKTPNNKRILVVSAPSGAGKTTICNFIVKKYPQFQLCISHTTRKPRGNEKNGREYFFVSEDEFQKMIDQNEFVEYAKVYDRYYYGTSWKAILSILDHGKNALLDIDVQGAEHIKEKFSDAELVFILPPSYDVLAQRLYGRKTDNIEEIKRRLKQAQKEIPKFEMFDFVIINDDLAETQKAISSIIEKHQHANMFTPDKMRNKIEHLIKNGSNDVDRFETSRS